MKRNLIRYLPDILKRNLEFQIIMKIQGDAGLEGAWEAAQAVFDDQFITSADKYGIARYEDILGLRPAGTDTLEERRAEVLMAWRANGSHSMQAIQAICDAWHNGWIKARYEPGYIVLEFLEPTGFRIPPGINKLKNRIDKVKPANLAYRYAVTPRTRPAGLVGYMAAFWVTPQTGGHRPVPAGRQAVSNGYAAAAAGAVEIHVTL